MHINCRQFVTKMHQIAPNCILNFKTFPGGNTPGPSSWGGGHPLPSPSPSLALLASIRGLQSLDVSTGTSL